MRNALFLTIVIFFFGCTDQSSRNRSPKYGNAPNELIVGPALASLVNSHAQGFRPLGWIGDEIVHWEQFQVTDVDFLTVREEPNTYFLRLYTAIPLKSGLPTLTWISRDDCRDGVMYGRVKLRDGKYLVGYKMFEKGYVILEIKIPE